MNNKALIRGYYGYRNIGDEAMLSVLIDMMKDEGFNPIVSSKNVLYSKRIHDVQVCSSRPDFNFLYNFIRCGYLIEGPGNKHGFLGIVDLGLPFLAKLMNKKVQYLGLGLNPNYWSDNPNIELPKDIQYPNPVKRTIIKFYFNIIVDKIVVRDTSSKTFLIMNGVEENRITVKDDFAFKLEIDNINTDLTQKIGNHLIVGISVRRFKKEEDNEIFFCFLYNIINRLYYKNNNIKFLFIPFSHGNFDNDIIYSEWIIEKLKKKNEKIICSVIDFDNPKLIKRVIKECHFLICVRYHSIIFSESLGIPYIAVIYDPKSQDVLKKSKHCVAHYPYGDLLKYLDESAQQVVSNEIFQP